MKRPYLYIFIITLLCAGTMVRAQQLSDSVAIAHIDSAQIHFKVSKWDLEPSMGDNAAQLDSIDRRLTSVFGDSLYTLRHVSIIGGASPEGSVAFNVSLGVGYTQGHYHKYTPEGRNYVWQSTHRRRYVGPTKLEVALVWLIGCGNYNRPKSIQD